MKLKKERTPPSILVGLALYKYRPEQVQLFAIKLNKVYVLVENDCHILLPVFANFSGACGVLGFF